MVSNTYCQFCDKECGNGANWSTHMGSLGHRKKAGAAPAVKVVMMFNSDDEFEDFEGPELSPLP